MKKSKVIMICREISRAEVVIEHKDDADLEDIKDKAWAQFDDNMEPGLEQENYTKVEELRKRDEE